MRTTATLDPGVQLLLECAMRERDASLEQVLNADSVEQERAADWLQEALNAPAGVGPAWIVIVGFIRIATQRGMVVQPLGATLVSFDRDVERFAGLRFERLQA
jgi:hypothetical protein